MTRSGNRCGRPPVATRTRVPRLWIVNPYAPVRPAGCAAMTAANVQDRNGAQLLLSPLAQQFRRLRLIWADGAYAGELETWTRGLRKWGKLRLEIVRKPKGKKGFAVLPWMWREERTFAWLRRKRRLRL